MSKTNEQTSQEALEKRRIKIERMEIREGSSYHKVFLILSRTEGFRRMVAELGERLQNASVVSHYFTFSRNWITDRYESYSYCRIDYGCERMYETGWSPGVDTFFTPKDRILTNEDVVRLVVTPHFGTKECPTYNCAKDIIVAKFPEFARKLIFENNPDVKAWVAVHEAKIVRQWNERRDAPSFRQDREEARALACLNDIRDQVEKYYRRRSGKINADGAADCLRRAAEAFLAQDVIVE